MAGAERRRLPAAARRALVEAAAARLFAERGYAATRLNDVAAAANVTKPVLYRHFETKKALYLALLERHRAQLPRFVQPGAPDEPLAARLPGILDGWFAYVEARPQAWTMIFRDSTGDAEIKAVRKELQESARGVIAALLRGQPELSIADEEFEPLAELLRGAMAGLALWWIDNPTVPRRLLVDLVVRATRGLLAPTEPGR
jgi:AcrR family transcriptional regulator